MKPMKSHKTTDLTPPSVQRQKAIAEKRLVSGWSTASRPSNPSSRQGLFSFPLDMLRTKSDLAQTLTTSVTQRESLPMKKTALLLGTWTAGSTSNWAKRSMRPNLQAKAQTMRKSTSVGLFDLQRPKTIVQTLPRLCAFYVPKGKMMGFGGGFRATPTIEQHCKCCQRLECLHSHPVLGDIRITTVLN
jgi:hypothetical protein